MTTKKPIISPEGQILRLVAGDADNENVTPDLYLAAETSAARMTTQHTSTSNDEDFPESSEGDLRGEHASNDSTWGEGAASAFQSFKTLEQRRAKSKPSDDRPSGD